MSTSSRSSLATSAEAARVRLAHDSSPSPFFHAPSSPMYEPERGSKWWFRRRLGPVDSLSVAHLVRLGFSKETARNALVYARNDVAFAIELAIHDTHPELEDPDCPVCRGKHESAAMRQWFKDQDLQRVGKKGRRKPGFLGSSLSLLTGGLQSQQQLNASRDANMNAVAGPSNAGPSTSPLARPNLTLLVNSLSSNANSGPSTPSVYATPTTPIIPRGLEDSPGADGEVYSDEGVSGGSTFPGAEPDAGEEDGETSFSNPMPTTPRSGLDALVDSYAPIYVPLNDDYGAPGVPGPKRVSYYSTGSGRKRAGEPSSHPASPLNDTFSKRLSGMSHSSPSTSHRSHPRAQSTSSFYSWYHSAGGPAGSGADTSPGPASPTRARSGSIGRAF